MSDQNIDPIDALTDAGLRPIIIDENTDFDALPKLNAFTIYDVLIHLRPEFKDAQAISGLAFEEEGLPFLGGCSVCGASIAAYNACPGKNGYLVGKCCANAHNTFATIEEFLATRETNDSRGMEWTPNSLEAIRFDALARVPDARNAEERIIDAIADAVKSGELDRARAPELARLALGHVEAETETNPAWTWICDECGSQNVQGTAWVHLNSNTIVQGDPPDDDYWCEDCDEHVGVTCGPRKPKTEGGAS